MRVPTLPGPHEVRTWVGRRAGALDQLVGAVPRIGALLDAAEVLIVDAAALIDRIEATRHQAAVLAARVERTRARADGVLTAVEAPLRRLLPTLERLAATTSPAEADAAVALVDNLPRLVSHIEQQVLPLLDAFGTVGPDVHELLDASHELNEMLGKLPGMGRIKRRVEEQQDS
jgi:ABC-type transporter Mla subunit MlaD